MSDEYAAKATVVLSHTYSNGCAVRVREVIQSKDVEAWPRFGEAIAWAINNLPISKELQVRIAADVLWHFLFDIGRDEGVSPEWLGKIRVLLEEASP